MIVTCMVQQYNNDLIIFRVSISGMICPCLASLNCRHERRGMGGEETLNSALNYITYLALPSSVIVAAAIATVLTWSGVMYTI